MGVECLSNYEHTASRRTGLVTRSHGNSLDRFRRATVIGPVYSAPVLSDGSLPLVV